VLRSFGNRFRFGLRNSPTVGYHDLMMSYKVFTTWLFGICVLSCVLNCVPNFAQAQVNVLPQITLKDVITKYELKDFNAAEQVCSQLSQSKPQLPEYVAYYCGKTLFDLKKFPEAERQFTVVHDLAANAKLDLDSNYYLGLIALEQKKYSEARLRLTKLEKRSRREENYPEVIFQLARAEQGLFNRGPVCKWLRKLYTRYPHFEKIQSWGPKLSQNSFDGKLTNCAHTREDLRSRIKNLQWAGLAAKALSEIQSLRTMSTGEEKYDVDRLEAGFHLHEGEVTKALELLVPYYETKKNDYNYLNVMAMASARAGEMQAAVGSYYKAYQLSPRGKFGRQALFQSAFMSYQFQDYDGATRKFQEFIKKYSGSGLTRDAKWHLAWIQYLRGDYQGAHTSMKKLMDEAGRSRRSAKNFARDRVQYWMGMSLFRQQKYVEARTLFEKLKQDRMLGYYSIAAGARLKKIETLLPRVLAPHRQLRQLPRLQMETIEVPDEVLAQEAALALTPPEQLGPISEEEESEALISENEEIDPAAAEQTENAATPAPFANPNLVAKFNQAQALIQLGLGDWAKWDLFEIEKRTSKKEYLKTLMQQYEAVGSYHRSSYIAQVSFGAQRGLHGIDGVRYLWQHAFPQAYKDSVQKYSSTNGIPSELVWGIMRAESQFKRDVVSPVGALGLMQVMPLTGTKVAELMKEKNFQSRQLLDPDPAIRIGAKYLQRLSSKFEDNLAMVAAGYNAGPHRVQSWVANFGNLDLDEWIEHIPFVETRNYVKKVLANINVYSQLYGGDKQLIKDLAGPLNTKIGKLASTKETWEEI
jgi:soluble lytic murein transglycosylase